MADQSIPKSTAAGRGKSSGRNAPPPAFLSSVGESKVDPSHAKEMAAMLAAEDDPTGETIDMIDQVDLEVTQALEITDAAVDQLTGAGGAEGGAVRRAAPQPTPVPAQPVQQATPAPVPTAQPIAPPPPTVQYVEPEDAPMPMAAAEVVRSVGSLEFDKKDEKTDVEQQIINNLLGRPDPEEQEREVEVGSVMPVVGQIAPVQSAAGQARPMAVRSAAQRNAARTEQPQATPAPQLEPQTAPTPSLTQALDANDDWANVEADMATLNQLSVQPVEQKVVASPRPHAANPERSVARQAATELAPQAKPTQKQTALDAAIQRVNQATTPRTDEKPAASPTPVKARPAPQAPWPAVKTMLGIYIECPEPYDSILRDLYDGTQIFVSQEGLSVEGVKLDNELADAIKQHLKLEVKVSQ